MSEAGQAWEQLPGENNLWFRRFEAFRRMGPRRAVLGVYNKEREQKGAGRRESLPQAWSQAAHKWNWRARAEAWDVHQSEKAEAEWERRAKQHRDDEWAARGQLLDKARQMLVFPLAKTSREEQVDGKTIVTTILPTKWTMRDAVAMFELASKLGRLATQQETEMMAVDLRSAAKEAGLDPDDPVIYELIRTVIEKLSGKADPPAGGDDRGAGPAGSGAAEGGAGAGSEGAGGAASGVASPPHGGSG